MDALYPLFLCGLCFVVRAIPLASLGGAVILTGGLMPHRTGCRSQVSKAVFECLVVVVKIKKLFELKQISVNSDFKGLAIFY